jgi:hypothetical protein
VELLGYPAKKSAGDRAMFGKLARGAFLVILAVMVVSWAVAASKSKPAEPPDDQSTGRMYS